MSTTVVASAYNNADLYLRPWSTPAVDLEAVRRVLEVHGLEVFDVSPLVRGLEGVAAVGMAPAPANALARDLRAVGLTVRVVNDASLTANARLGNAAGVLLLLAIVTFPLVLPAILALVNALYILSRGSGLHAIAARAAPLLAGESEPPGRVALARIRELTEQLPAELLTPLIARAEALARDAARDPDGAAARGLEEIVADLQGEAEVRIATEAKELKADLARARRAVREVE